MYVNNYSCLKHLTVYKSLYTCSVSEKDLLTLLW